MASDKDMQPTKIFLLSQQENLKTYLKEHATNQYIVCEPVEPEDSKGFTEAELDNYNGCQGCGFIYEDEDVLVVDSVGPICFNCLYNLALLAFDGDFETALQSALKEIVK